jgi:hypothetical protein
VPLKSVADTACLTVNFHCPAAVAAVLSGFDAYNSSAVRVTLKRTLNNQAYSAPCTPTHVTPTSVTCLTSPPPAAACPNSSISGSTCSFSIAITPSDSGVTGGEFMPSNLTSYMYSADLTPSVSSITPTRGSTEGGTVVTITGSNLEQLLQQQQLQSTAAAASGRKMKQLASEIQEQHINISQRHALQSTSSSSFASSVGINAECSDWWCAMQ